MSKDNFSVKRIHKQSEYAEWLLKKHYAHRIPSISYAFGLYKDGGLKGVCTFGISANYIESKKWYPYSVYELNRLCVDCEEKNITSWFLSRSIKLVEKPSILISYSDIGIGHYGYIYQATNWVYTGIGAKNDKIFVMQDGAERHQRHRKNINMELVDHIRKSPKNRYYYFNGNKGDKKKMQQILRYKVLPYPKGKTQRYDASYKPTSQMVMF